MLLIVLSCVHKFNRINKLHLKTLINRLMKMMTAEVVALHHLPDKVTSKALLVIRYQLTNVPEWQPYRTLAKSTPVSVTKV